MVPTNRDASTGEAKAEIEEDRTNTLFPNLSSSAIELIPDETEQTTGNDNEKAARPTEVPPSPSQQPQSNNLFQKLYADLCSKDERSGDSSHEGPNAMSPYLMTHKTYLLLWLIVLLGLSVSTVFVVLGVRALHEEEELRLEKETNAISASVQTAWNDYNFAALWAHHACSAPIPPDATQLLSCSREDFRALFEYIKSSEGLSFRSIAYVPNVTHARRPVFEAEAAAYYHDQPSMNYSGFTGLVIKSGTDSHEFELRPEQAFYFPQHFVEPLEGNECLVDFDLYSSAFSFQIDNTVATRQPLSSTPIPTQPPYPPGNYVFLLHPGIQTFAYGKEQPIGLTSIKVSFLDLMQRAAVLYTSTNTGKTVRVSIYGSTSSSTAYFFGGIELSIARNGTVELGSALEEVPFDQLVGSERGDRHKHVRSQDLEVFQIKWTVVVVTEDSRHYDAFVIVGAVLIFVTSCALATWLYFRMRRTSREADLRVSEDSQRAAEQAALVLSQTENQLSQTEKQVRAQRELNEYMAHEVRNPLAAAISACSFLAASNQEALSALSDDGNESDTESALNQQMLNQQDIDVIHNSLHYVDDLLRSVLDMQKAANNQLKLVESHTDVLKDLFEPVRSILGHRGDAFEFQVSCPDHLVILGDRMRLKQIVLNLASNSRKFTQQGFVRLSGDVVNGFVQIAVEDSGPGIPESKRARLFDERYQESLDSLQQGTGMGLSLCNTLVKLMGGNIALDETFNSGISGCPGARFVVSLNTPPIEVDDLDIERVKPADPNSQPPTVLRTPSGRRIETSSEASSNRFDYSTKELPENLSVLVTDDDLVIRKMFRRSLERVAGTWTVQEAANGETALVLTESNTYDIIFVDQYMASVQKQLLGTETVVAMRARGVKSCICGLSANEIRDDFIKAGATGFMRKPFPTGKDELTKALVELLVDAGVL